MINNFDIAVGIRQEGILSQPQIFGENIILSDLLKFKPFAINNDHFHEGFFTDKLLGTLATLDNAAFHD
jgi:hypothetical protein